MRIEQVSFVTESFAHRSTNLFIGVTYPTYLGTNRIVRASVQIEYSREITGITHVHRISDSGDRRPRRINSRTQVLQKYIVAVIGRNEPFHRQSHTFSHQTGSNIAEISAGHTEHDIFGLPD